MANLVFTCASTKSYPVTLFAKDYSSPEEWREAVEKSPSRYPVKTLYKGAYWKEVMQLYADYPEHSFFVLSAGIGLIPFEAMAPSYEASFSSRSMNTVPLDWIRVTPLRGIVSTSNEYATVANLMGLTILKPSGRRWLQLLGGTGFTLAPRLIRLYLQGADLSATYNSLPAPQKQPLPERRMKASNQTLDEIYIKGMTATALRRKTNSAGYGVSVERAFTFIKDKEL